MFNVQRAKLKMEVVCVRLRTSQNSCCEAVQHGYSSPHSYRKFLGDVTHLKIWVIKPV